MEIDLQKYKEFVLAVTSDESKDLTSLVNRLNRVDTNYEEYGPNGEMEHGPDVNVPLLLTSAIGLASETGEFSELVKKILFQGKLLSDDVKNYMGFELGDIFGNGFLHAFH